MKQGYFIDENGTRLNIDIPDGMTDLTESINSSRTIGILLSQHKEQCKQNRRIFIASIAACLISMGSLIVSIISLFK